MLPLNRTHRLNRRVGGGVSDVEKNQNKVKNDLTMLISNPPDLKEDELLDQIQHEYKYYDRKLSAYLS